MKGIVLAAGRGSRLGAPTDDRPKALVEVGGRTLLHRQVRALRAAGANEVGCVGGWRADLFTGLDLPLFVNELWSSTSMVESLACASTWLTTSICLVSYGDIVYSAADARRLADADGDVVIAQDPNWLAMWKRRFADPLDDAETFRADRAGRLLEIGYRPQTLDEVQGQYLGLLRFTPAGWDEVIRVTDERRPRSMTDLLSAVVTRGRIPVETVAVEDPWWEFDEPEDVVIGAEVVRRLDALDWDTA
jgi:choline kinase